MTVAAPRQPKIDQDEVESRVRELEALIEEARRRARRRRLFVGAAILAAVAALGAAVFHDGGGGATLARSQANANPLDPGFGKNGFVVLDGLTSCLTGEGGCGIRGIGLALQPDGAAVVSAGTLEANCRSRFALARVRAGKVDPSFGQAGRVVTGFAASAAVANAVVVAPDGKIVVAGEHLPAWPGSGSCPDHIHQGGGDGFALARYQPNGELDKSFGADGTVVTKLEDSGAFDLLLQPDGKVIAVGYGRSAVQLARYLNDGSLDRSFGEHGITTSQPSPGAHQPGRPTLDRAGRIIVPLMPPYCKSCGTSIARYTSEGRLDKSFGHNGATSLPLDVAIAARVTSRGIFVYGTMHGIGGNRGAVVLLSSKGKLDSRFGRNGILLSPRAGMMYDASIQKDGKVVELTTRSGARAEGGYALTRLLPNGTLDRSFGVGGTMTVPLAPGSSGRRVASLGNGKLIVASLVGTSYPTVTVTRHLR
ncbi:MAG: hypothetical protein WCF27_02960 [Gaiellaceae bacterium]